MNLNATLSLPPRPTFLVVLESGIAILFMCLALTGNLTVCLAISRNKLLRTVPNFLLLNLAIADVFSAVVSFPLLVSVLVRGVWSFHETVCQFHAFQTYASYACSLMTLAVTSITRYYATVHPVKHRAKFKVKTVYLLIAVIWVASFLIASAPLLGWGRYKFEPFYALCIHDHNFSATYNIFLFFFLIVNSTIIVTSYSKIFKATKTRHRRVHLLFAHGSRSRQMDMINAQEVKLTNTIFIVICLFALCYLPTIVLGFLLFTPVAVPRFARMLSTFSVGLTSVVNPMVYWVRSKAFREAWKEVFRKKEEAAVQDSAHIEPSHWNSLGLFSASRRNSSNSVKRKRTVTLPIEDLNL